MITSKFNENIKYIKSLNEKKFRQKYSAYILEGVKVINELLDIYENKAIDVEFIAYSLDILSKVNGGNNLLELIKKNDKIKVLDVSKEVFEDLTETVNPQGLLAVVKMKEYSFNDLNLSEDILILDRVQDSGNIGTIIRSAVAFGVKNIILIKGSADIYSPKVVRSTMLNITECNIVFVDDESKLFSFLKKNSYNIYATSLYESNYVSQDTFKGKCALIVGNEANGVSSEILKKSDKKIKIKIEDEVESLNVATATSILLNYLYNKNE